MNEKKEAGVRSADFIKDGMIVGLGTGSTVYYMLERLAERLKEGLKIKGVTTSSATTALAQSLGIPLVSIHDIEGIDLTIDGADEVDPKLNGIKGGGGALLYEKVVARLSKKVIWIVDSAKQVSELGDFPLPVEVVPFGYTHLFRCFEQKGLQPKLRKSGEDVLVTDSGHYIIDIKINKVQDLQSFASWLDSLTGVVEHGLFLGMTNILIVGKRDGAEVIESNS